MTVPCVARGRGYGPSMLRALVIASFGVGSIAGCASQPAAKETSAAAAGGGSSTGGGSNAGGGQGAGGDAATTGGASGAGTGLGGSASGAGAAGTGGIGGSTGPAAGDGRLDAKGVAQVWVPPGTFVMGSDPASIAAVQAQSPPAFVASELPSEEPPHSVTLTVGYWLDRREVTNARFAEFVADGGYTNQALWSTSGWAWLAVHDKTKLPVTCSPNDPELPRVCVTWFEADAYARWRGGRLPTEAEWEYAARGPEAKIYPWGNEFDPTLANVVGSTSAVVVGSFPAGASWVGAEDMAGNAMEWVADWLDIHYYATSPAVDPTGPAAGKIKVERGGWWGSNPFVARAAYRHYEDPPTYQDHHIGFRIVSPSSE